jgi:ABC-2 type transport system permease protein
MAEGVVFDLGYKPHEGQRLGRRGARKALVKDGLRRVLGLRRKARRKILPAALMSIAIMPALFFTAFAVVAGDFDVSETIFGHADYFNLNASMALIFVALAASELLIPDRVNGTMAVYASRPLTTPDYVVGRALALAIVVFNFLWIPHVVLFVGRAWVSSQGFGSYLTDHYEVLWQTALISVIYFVAYTSIAFLVAAFSKRTAVAAGVYLGVVTLSGATGALVDAGYDVFGLGAILDHPGYVKDWILGASRSDWIPYQAGMEPYMSLLVIAVLAVVAGLVVTGRYRRAA